MWKGICSTRKILPITAPIEPLDNERVHPIYLGTIIESHCQLLKESEAEMIVQQVKRTPLVLLLVVLPLVLAGEILRWPGALMFTFSVIGIVPLAHFMGLATEVLAAHTGPRLGGLINATLGNAAELIITVIALRAGLLELVKASITGSIIGNVLFVMGGALLLGGLRHGVQSFDRMVVGVSATQLVLAVIALIIPTLFSTAIEPSHFLVTELSLSVALVMIVLYALGVLFGVRNGAHGPTHRGAPGPRWSSRHALLVLVMTTAGIAALSEVLVKAVEATVATLGISEFFIGIIIVPIIGNAAEHLVAISAARKDQMDLSLEVTLGSSIQVALFIAPLLVFLSLPLAPEPLTLVFHPFELVALAAAALVAALIAQDGRSNWMEGAQLLGVYFIIALAFFFLP